MRPGHKSLFQLLLAALPVLTGCAAPRSAGPMPAAGVDISDCGGSVREIEAFWETDSGERIKLRDLNGRVHVISMFYATCQGVCLMTKQDMQQIEASLSREARKRVGFVLVTLDAAHDTAQVLRSYRNAEGLSRSRWTLLRGDDAATSRLAALLGIGSGRDASGRFVHSSELVVLDESGCIIHRHNGLRADLQSIAGEVGAAALTNANF